MKKDKYLEIRKKVNFTPQPFRLFLDHIINLGLIGFSYGAWISAIFPLRCLAVVGMAILMFRNFSLMHDGTHGSLSKSKWINNFFGVVAGIFCFLPFEPWRQSHLTHHFWSGNLEKDPVMAIALAYPKLPVKVQKLMDFFWMLWLPALAILQYGLFWVLSIGNLFKKPSILSFISVAAGVVFWAAVAIYASFGFLVYAVLPALGLYLILVEVVNFPHHLQMTLVRGEKRFSIWEQYLTARTCLYPDWFARYVVLNFNYHAEHHVFPDLPWYQLPLAHQYLLAELGDRLNCDTYFAWNLENRKHSIAKVIVTVEDISDLKRAH